MTVAPADPVSVKCTPAPPRAPRPSRVTVLQWLPVPLLLIAVIVFGAIGSPRSFEQPHLLIGLNLVCATMVSLVIALLVGRSFLVQGTLDLLGLGMGVVIWGLASLLSPLLADKNPNALTSIHNCGVWLGGLCLLAGALAPLRPVRVRLPGLWLLVAQSAAVGAVVLVASLALGGHMPDFFIQGQGGTPVRQLILISATGMLILAAIVL